MKNVRTNTLKKHIADGAIRLSKNDREFFTDLAKVGIIESKDADNFHYAENKTKSTHRLGRLCEAGILEPVTINQPGRGKYVAYTFKSQKIAGLFGGKIPTIGRKRNALHEVITSKLFFAEGRPKTWKLESQFEASERKMFELSSPSLTNRRSALPDAMYVKDNGEIVVVEADSGQYSKNQIRSKQSAWGGFKQVWGQPSKAASRVDNAKVHLFQ